jgi:glycosyltransferase involved in cell wall biosynthesis
MQRRDCLLPLTHRGQAVTFDGMQICIDVQAAVAQRAGVGRYTRNLVEHLAPLARDCELRAFYFDFRHGGQAFASAAVRERPIRWCPGRLVQWGWKTLHWPPVNWLAGAADLYHFPNFTIPPLRRGRAIVTIHDMSFMRFPDFAESKNLQYLSRTIGSTVDRADAIITISEFSRSELAAFFPAAAAKAHAIPLGLQDGFARPPDDRIASVLRELKLTRPYMLNVGTIEPRKNQAFLVDVFEKLTRFDGELVIAGMPGWKSDPVMARIRRSPIADRIRLLHFVEDTSLPSLYAAAELFVFPSHYEGFGFPPLEAMACGTAVVSSRGGSLPEVLGDAVLMLPDFDAERWSHEIDALLTDSARRRDLADRGTRHAAQYTWRRTAEQTLALYREVAA